MGVNTLEMDVVVTKDSQLVISHDPYMSDVICNTPEGKPVTAANKENYAIYHLTYAEVKKFDCGSRGNPDFPGQHKMPTYKPLLKDVIDSVENYIAANHLPHVQYNIETKSTVAGDGKLHPVPAVFSKMLYDLLKNRNMLPYSIIQSFDVRTLQEIHKIDGKTATALLIADPQSFDKNLKQLGFTPSIYSPNTILVNKKLIEKCHKKKVKIIPWTINDEKKMLEFKDMGVDGLITDYPDKAIKVLRK